MNASANPKTGLRPFLPADTPVVAAIFRASIEELTEDDYNPAQQEAWASLADDEEVRPTLAPEHRGRRILDGDRLPEPGRRRHRCPAPDRAGVEEFGEEAHGAGLGDAGGAAEPGGGGAILSTGSAL